MAPHKNILCLTSYSTFLIFLFVNGEGLVKLHQERFVPSTTTHVLSNDSCSCTACTLTACSHGHISFCQGDAGITDSMTVSLPTMQTKIKHIEKHLTKLTKEKKKDVAWLPTHIVSSACVCSVSLSVSDHVTMMMQSMPPMQSDCQCQRQCHHCAACVAPMVLRFTYVLTFYSHAGW